MRKIIDYKQDKAFFNKDLHQKDIIGMKNGETGEFSVSHTSSPVIVCEPNIFGF